MSELPDSLAINALFAGTYSDPFALLGMHQTANGLEVRALLPDASGLTPGAKSLS